jgi:hypothetical protein
MGWISNLELDGVTLKNLDKSGICWVYEEAFVKSKHLAETVSKAMGA